MSVINLTFKISSFLRRSITLVVAKKKLDSNYRYKRIRQGEKKEMKKCTGYFHPHLPRRFLFQIRGIFQWEKSVFIPSQFGRTWGEVCPDPARNPTWFRKIDPYLCTLSYRLLAFVTCWSATPSDTWIRKPSIWKIEGMIISWSWKIVNCLFQNCCQVTFTMIFFVKIQIFQNFQWYLTSKLFLENFWKFWQEKSKNLEILKKLFFINRKNFKIQK